MKIEHLFEMTMKVPSYENLGQTLPHFQQLKTTGTHCGDIEKYNVFKKSRNNMTDYAVFENDTCIAFFVIVNPNILKIGYIIPEKRNIGLSPMFLFFLKRNEGMSQIIMGDKQSEQAIKSLSKTSKLFKTSWVKGNHKVPYDPDTIDQFYNYQQPTGWVVMLENEGDFSDWPKYYVHGVPDLKMYYSSYIEDDK